MPIFQAHGVVLPNSEALLLMGANHIADHVPEEPPIIEPPLPEFHSVVVGTAVQAQREKTLQRLLGEEEDAARRENSRHFAKDALDIHELAEHLKGADEAQSAVGEGEIGGIARQPDRRPFQPPGVLQRAAVTQGISRKIKCEAFGAEFVGQHVARMARIGANLEEGRHRADEFQMIADHRAAADVFLGVDAQIALRLAERREVVKFHLGALDGQRLRFHFVTR